MLLLEWQPVAAIKKGWYLAWIYSLLEIGDVFSWMYGHVTIYLPLQKISVFLPNDDHVIYIYLKNWYISYSIFSWSVDSFSELDTIV